MHYKMDLALAWLDLVEELYQELRSKINSLNCVYLKKNLQNLVD